MLERCQGLGPQNPEDRTTRQPRSVSFIQVLCPGAVTGVLKLAATLCSLLRTPQMSTSQPHLKKYSFLEK